MEILMEDEQQTNRVELKRLSENRMYPLTLSDNCKKKNANATKAK